MSYMCTYIVVQSLYYLDYLYCVARNYIYIVVVLLILLIFIFCVAIIYLYKYNTMFCHHNNVHRTNTFIFMFLLINKIVQHLKLSFNNVNNFKKNWQLSGFGVLFSYINWLTLILAFTDLLDSFEFVNFYWHEKFGLEMNMVDRR